MGADLHRTQLNQARKARLNPLFSPHPLNIQPYLDRLLEEAAASNDSAFITHALGTIARARGMSRVAAKTGLSRESLYRALRADGNPEFATVMRVMQALGLKLSVTPANDSKPKAKGTHRQRMSA